MSDLQVKTKRDDDLGILGVTGEVRTEIAFELYAAAQALVDEGAKHLLVDLGAVRFMDSASLATLIRLDSELKKASGRLVLFTPSKPVRRVLEHSGLGDRFLVADDEAAARTLAHAE